MATTTTARCLLTLWNVGGGGKMKIPARHHMGVTILEPKGKITIGVGDVALREAVHEAVEAGADKILINLEEVTV